MTEQQERFAIEYARTGNATQSALSAGYSEKGADVQGCRLLGNVKVQEKIAELKAKMAEDLRKEMAREALTAFNTLVSIMNKEGAKDSDKIKCAIDLLDRAGYVAEKKVEVSASKKDMDKADEIMRQFGMLDV